MKATALKKEMHEAIDLIDDSSFLKAINVLLVEKSKEYEYSLNADEQKELDELRKQHKVGKSKSYSIEEVRKIALLKRAK